MTTLILALFAIFLAIAWVRASPATFLVVVIGGPLWLFAVLSASSSHNGALAIGATVALIATFFVAARA